MTTQDQTTKPNADIGDLLGSMMGLAKAGTQFTIAQMQNAIAVFTDSQSVMNNVRDSLDNISKAMTKLPAEMTTASEPKPARTVFTGRKL